MSHGVKADLVLVDDHVTGTSRALFEGAKETASEVLDFFTGVDQSDVEAGRVKLDDLSREDRIALLVDNEIPGVFGSSPWSIGASLDASVSDEIHANKGGTLVFGITADLIDAAESKLRSVRVALVWDDTIVSDVRTLDVSVIGPTFLILGVADEPKGRRLTLWITDDDLKVSLLRQGALQQLAQIQKEVIGEVGKAGEESGNPIADIGNKVLGFFTISQVAGIAILGVIGLVLIVVIKSDTAKAVAKNVKVGVGV